MESAPTPAYRIALIDDEPQILSALQRELRNEPLDVVVFNDPTAALDAICQGQFAVILSDNLMPSLTGLELLARIKESRPMARRILLTGRTDLNQAVDAFNAGTIHCFLHKPWDKNQLLETIRKELDTYRSSAEQAESNAKQVEQGKARTVKLISTMKELKQAQTQLLLIEDSNHLEVLKVSPGLRRLSVLVVEEHEALRDLLIDAIRGVGIAQCHGVPHVTAALTHLTAAPRVDVILSEWSLDGIDGLEFLRRLRASATPSAGATFLLMAGHDQKTMVEFAMKSGVDGYLVKPFHLQALLKRIESLRNLDDLTQLDDLTPLRKATILVANSHPASRDQIESFLCDAGIPGVIGATFGPGAVALIREHQPDIVIYDVNVKEPTWDELPGQLKKQARLPSLLVTGVLSDDGVFSSMQKAGMKHYLPGPFTRSDLVRAVVGCWKPVSP